MLRIICIGRLYALVDGDGRMFATGSFGAVHDLKCMLS